jgi:GTP 3',8-cyclase
MTSNKYEDILMDRQGRQITYLRLSVTDRCNLRCRYCMPPEGCQWIPHDEILRYMEMLRITNLLAGLGIQKVRITGGEPLVRKDLIYLIHEIKKIPGIREISLTTNGVLLADQAKALKNAGIDRVNISLDSLKADVFAAITGHKKLDAVLKGIDAAISAGITPVKINVVAMAGVNDLEMEELAALSFREDIHVRFIEQMPIGMRYSKGRIIFPMEMVKQRIESRLGPMTEIESSPLDGPARRYQIKGATGEIGFIHAMTRHFCNTCNRIRLTADGQIRPCLLDDTAIDVKKAMRAGMSDQGLVQLIKKAIQQKQPAHETSPTVNSQMASIGG